MGPLTLPGVFCASQASLGSLRGLPCLTGILWLFQGSSVHRRCSLALPGVFCASQASFGSSKGLLWVTGVLWLSQGYSSVHHGRLLALPGVFCSLLRWHNLSCITVVLLTSWSSVPVNVTRPQNVRPSRQSPSGFVSGMSALRVQVGSLEKSGKETGRSPRYISRQDDNPAYHTKSFPATRRTSNLDTGFWLNDRTRLQYTSISASVCPPLSPKYGVAITTAQQQGTGRRHRYQGNTKI